MKTKIVSSLLVVALASSAITVCAQRATERKRPELKIDSTPVETAGAPRVSSYADIVEPAQKVVVSVYSSKIVRQRMPINPLFRQFFGDQLPERESREEGLGSGVIISSDGYILTNNHVVEGADELNVSLPDEREFKATVIGSDPKTDVAVIKIEATDLPVVTLADSDKLRVGDVVFAVGNPLGIGQTVTMGIVSATGRNNLGLLDDGAGYENFIQTDAAINMGNSGGALIDAKGRLVGVNTAIISTTRGNIGIGFAIPINLAASTMHSLIETGTVQRGFLGVSVDPLTPDLAETMGLKKDTKGVVINQLADNDGIPGPAETAGLKVGDVILSINDRSVVSLQDLRLLVAQMLPESEVSVKVMRDGKDSVFKVKLGKLADSGAASNELLKGVKATRVDDEARRSLGLPDNVDGLLVTGVDEDSPYARVLLPNMVVVEINREPAKDLPSSTALLRDGRNLFLVYYRGVFRWLPVTVE